MEKSFFTFITEHHSNYFSSILSFTSKPKDLFWPYRKEVWINILLDLFQRNHQVQATQNFLTEASQCWNCLHAALFVFFTFSHLKKTLGTFSQKNKTPILIRLLSYPFCVSYKVPSVYAQQLPLKTFLDLCSSEHNLYLDITEWLLKICGVHVCGDSFKIYIQHCDSFDVTVCYPFLSSLYLL